jgi:cobalt-zinc-cadmium efflux system protein
MTSTERERSFVSEQRLTASGSPADTALEWARVAAGVLCVVAGVVHLLYAPVHFEESHNVGFFFVAVGVDQIAAGLFLIAAPLVVPVAGATLLGTLAVIVIYVASRTTGLPIGPNPGVPGVGAVHDLHVWTITSGFVAMSAHVLANGSRPSADVLHDVQDLLRDRFAIEHTTLQVEQLDHVDDGACCTLDPRCLLIGLPPAAVGTARH